MLPRASVSFPVPDPDDGVELLWQLGGERRQDQRDQTRWQPDVPRGVLDRLNEDVSPAHHQPEGQQPLREDGPRRGFRPQAPEREPLRHLLQGLARVEGPPDVEGVSRDQQERKDDLQGEEQLYDPYPGGHAEEEQKERYVPGDGIGVDVDALSRGPAPGKLLHGGLPAAYLAPLLPAPAERQGAGPHDEHRERHEHKRRPEDRTDPYLAGDLAVAVHKDDGQERDYGDHGLRQGCAHGRENAPHRPLAQVQASAQNLHGVGKERCREDDGGQSEGELHEHRQNPYLIRTRNEREYKRRAPPRVLREETTGQAGDLARQQR